VLIVLFLRSIEDEDGPAVAREFYAALLAKEVIDADAVAYALDEAVSKLRRQDVSPTRWAPFIHVGA
jgi:CHAT domain-containing protein